MDSRPYPPEGHPSSQASFDSYDSRQPPYSSPSSHSASSTLSDDRYKAPHGPPQQHQQHHMQHQRLHPAHQHDQQHDRMDMDIEGASRTPSQHSSHFKRSSPTALPDPAFRSRQPSTPIHSSYHSHGPSSLSSRPEYADMSQDNPRGPHPPSSHPPYIHGPPPHHPSYPSSSFSTASPALMENDRERDKEREPEHTGLGGRGQIGQHPEESLHTLSSFAFHHRHQQQQQQQPQPQPQPPQQRRESLHQQGWHSSQSRSLPPSPTRDVGSYPRGPLGVSSDYVALTAGESARHSLTAGSQDRALPLSRLEIKDPTSADTADRALDHATALSSVSPTFDDDVGRRFSQSYPSQYPHRPRLDQEHGRGPDYHYYDEQHQHHQRGRETDRDADRPSNYQPHVQIDTQGRLDQRAIGYPAQHPPADQRYMHQEHRPGSFPSSPFHSGNSQQHPYHHPHQPHQQPQHQQQPQQQPPQPPPPQQQPHPPPPPPPPHHQQPQQPTRDPPPQEPSEKRVFAPKFRVPNIPRMPMNYGGDNTHDSSYDSNNEDDEDSFNYNDHDYRSKFGTDMPSTVDLKSAIESCDILCKFALHYSAQTNAVHDESRGSSLDPEVRANLQKIRNMNTTMLIGLQTTNKAYERSGTSGGGGGGEGERASQHDNDERETSPMTFGSGPPPHEMVHELAKVATSIFQLAIRIKSWVGMTPEERELDEDISMIRGKRCLLMDSTVSASTVDQHGKVQKDWTIVPTSSSMSKSYYERQREVEQRTHQHHNQHPSSASSSYKQNQQQQPVYIKQDPSLPGPGERGDRSRIGMDQDESSIRRASSSSSIMSLSTPQFAHSLSSAVPSSHSSDSTVSRLGYSTITGVNDPRKLEESQSPNRKEGGEAPYQKYRKRAKRTQPPGRCLSCDSSDTPEWRRGPDGARTLCNACGLHYAKLLKRQGEQANGPTNIKSRATSVRMEQLQAITFPLRKRTGSQVTEPLESGSGTVESTSATVPGLGTSTSTGSGSGPSSSSNQSAQPTEGSLAPENASTPPPPPPPPTEKEPMNEDTN